MNASELLSATQGGVDPRRQLITVIRKESREAQELPASTDAFVWLRLYQVEMDGVIPTGHRRPLWWTLRRPARPLTYHAAHRMFERVNDRAGTSATLHALRHTAAYRMAEDPALPLTDVQFVLGHAQLTTTQLYLTPRKEGGDPPGAGPSCPAEPASRKASRSATGRRLPSRGTERAVRKRCPVTTIVERPQVWWANNSVVERDAGTTSPAPRQEARARFPRLARGSELARALCHRSGRDHQRQTEAEQPPVAQADTRVPAAEHERAGLQRPDADHED